MIQFAELSGFGFNVLTLSFIATLVFTTMQAIALWKQNQRILREKSGESVSFSFYVFFGFSLLAVIIYGLSNHSLALSINGLLGFPALAIAYNLNRFKALTNREELIAILSLQAVPAMIFSPNRDIVFLGLGLVISITVGMQIYEIWRNKSSGSYHPAQVFVSIVSCSFWLIYAFIVDIWAMQVSNSIFLFFWLTLLFSYLKFKKVRV